MGGVTALYCSHGLLRAVKVISPPVLSSPRWASSNGERH